MNEHLFCRTRTPDPRHFRQAMAWALDLAKITKELTAASIEVHRSALGPDPTAIVWSMQIGSLAQLDKLTSLLETNDSYAEFCEQGADLFLAPFRDCLSEIVVAPDPRANTQFHHVVAATSRNNRRVDATVWGAETSEYVAKITGRSVLFGRQRWGETGRMVWMLALADAADVDAVSAMLKHDLGYLKRLDRAAEFFEPAQTTARLVKRVSAA